MATTSNFYVYEHWRLDRDECFYVGKGRGYRAYCRKGRNTHWRNIVNKLQRIGSSYEVRIVADGLTEERSFDLEIERIAFWRDIVDLTNITNGGDGCSGMVHSAEVRARIRANTPVRRAEDHPLFGKDRPDSSARMKRLWNTEEFRAKMAAVFANKTLTKEHRAKLRAANIGRTPWNKGRPFCEDVRAKMSAAAKKRVVSSETCAKLSANARAQWAKHRADGREGNLGAPVRPNKLSVSVID